MRARLGRANSQLVMGKDMATILRGSGQAGWAATLDREEEAHMVLVKFSGPSAV